MEKWIREGITDVYFRFVFRGWWIGRRFLETGYTSVAHIEMDKDAINTLHTRLAYHYLVINGKQKKYWDYLKNKFSREDLYLLLPACLNDTIINQMLTESTLDDIYEKIDKNMKQMNCTDIDVLIGGHHVKRFLSLVEVVKNTRIEVIKEIICIKYMLKY